MSKPEVGQTLKAVFLHQSITWPGHPAEKTLTQEKLPGVVMRYYPPVITLERKGSLAFVPLSNVINMVIEDLDTK